MGTLELRDSGAFGAVRTHDRTHGDHEESEHSGGREQRGKGIQDGIHTTMLRGVLATRDLPPTPRQGPSGEPMRRQDVVRSLPVSACTTASGGYVRAVN